MRELKLMQCYDDLWRTTKRQVAKNGFALDELIGAPDDTRYGITLRLRPSLKVRRRIGHLLDTFRSIEPDQYYYPEREMHVTVLTLLTCMPGFTLQDIDASRYVALLEDCLEDLRPFELRFRGVTASPSCVMVQGFDDAGALACLRDRVRAAFKRSGLEHTIDQRYVTTLAHSTVMRFAQPIRDAKALIELVKRHRQTELGVSRTSELELVGNDWYHTNDTLQMLAILPLRGNSAAKAGRQAQASSARRGRRRQ